MLGAIIGDIVGSIHEYKGTKTKDFPLFTKKSAFTDDTIMTIAVAEALLNGGTAGNFIDSMKMFGRLFPDGGYGGQFGGWLRSDDRLPYNSWGNGAAMRVSPCAWFADSLEEAERLAELLASVTHNHPEGIKGARATAAAIYMARTLRGKRSRRIVKEGNREIKEYISIDKKGDKHEIKDYIEKTYGYDLSRTLDGIRPGYSFNESCQETVPQAIIAFLEGKGFEDTIRNAVSLGGDADTLAAIAGSIAEAAYLVWPHILTQTLRHLDDRLSAVINTWLDSGKPLGIHIAEKSDWKTKEFSKPHTIKADFSFGETKFLGIRCGHAPEVMEDKWFAYFANGRIHCHRSWTGFKIYEAEMKKKEGRYTISEILVERDVTIYKCTDDNEDIRSFAYLLGRGILGMDIKSPRHGGDAIDLLRDWSDFGRMVE
jgi:ADP-ribosylglycohydrolase